MYHDRTDNLGQLIKQTLTSWISLTSVPWLTQFLFRIEYNTGNEQLNRTTLIISNILFSWLALFSLSFQLLNTLNLEFVGVHHQGGVDAKNCKKYDPKISHFFEKYLTNVSHQFPTAASGGAMEGRQ